MLSALRLKEFLVPIWRVVAPQRDTMESLDSRDEAFRSASYHGPVLIMNPDCSSALSGFGSHTHSTHH
jgi:hypothetical protein